VENAGRRLTTLRESLKEKESGKGIEYSIPNTTQKSQTSRAMSVGKKKKRSMQLSVF